MDPSSFSVTSHCKVLGPQFWFEVFRDRYASAFCVRVCVRVLGPFLGPFLGPRFGSAFWVRVLGPRFGSAFWVRVSASPDHDTRTQRQGIVREIEQQKKNFLFVNSIALGLWDPVKRKAKLQLQQRNCVGTYCEGIFSLQH